MSVALVLGGWALLVIAVIVWLNWVGGGGLDRRRIRRASAVAMRRYRKRHP